MAVITPPQNIPSELLDAYMEIMQGETTWKETDYIRKRYPFRLPHMQGDGLITPDPDMGEGVSYAQFIVRRHFARAVHCWKYQPVEGGAEPPTVGPRNRSWWYDAADGSGLWYYDYFIQQTLIESFAGKVAPWCKLATINAGTVDSGNPDTPSGIEEPLYVALNYLAEGRTLWTYLYTDYIGRYLWLYTTVCWGTNCDITSRTISYYETTDEWNARTITWNNKPAVGELIGQKTFTGLPQWISLWIPDVHSIVIKLDTPTPYAYGFYSPGGAEVWARPYTNLFPD